ncbi:hypothetical protein KKH56_06015 [bacterium]|nr:hypothetical protein [bacterium]
MMFVEPLKTYRMQRAYSEFRSQGEGSYSFETNGIGRNVNMVHLELLEKRVPVRVEARQRIKDQADLRNGVFRNFAIESMIQNRGGRGSVSPIGA